MTQDLIKLWSDLYLLHEGKYEENPDEYKQDKSFRDADEYEKWMKEREKLMVELEPKKKIDEDDDEEEEINLIEEIESLKGKLVKRIEEVLDKREEYSEDEIKNCLSLLNSLEPEKLSDEDKDLLNGTSEEI